MGVTTQEGKTSTNIMYNVRLCLCSTCFRSFSIIPMGNSDSVPLKPEEVQTLRQTFTAERLEIMLEQAGSLYSEEEEGDPDQKVVEEVEAIKVKYEQEIFDLKKENKKKDELQRETERTLNEVKWELEEQIERNRRYETEFQRPKEDPAVEGTNISSHHQRIEESSKKTKEILRLKKERADLSTKISKLDKLMNDNEKLKDEEMTKMKEQCDFKLFQHELKLTFLQRKYDELNKNHAKALASLDLVELRANIYEINKDLLRKELDELKSENIRLKSESRCMKQVEDLNKDLLRKGNNELTEIKTRSLHEETILRKQVEYLKSENIGLKNWKELNNALVSKEVNELTEFKKKSVKEETTLKKQVEDLKSENIRLTAEKNWKEHNNALVSKEVNELTEFKKKSIKEETILKKQVEDLKSENIRLKAENDSLKKQININDRFRDVKSGN